MKHGIFAVLDAAAGCYSKPFFMPNSAVAARSFSDEVNRSDPNNNLHAHPGDFSLVDLGTFDDVEGTFQLHEQKQTIAQAASLKRELS